MKKVFSKADVRVVRFASQDIITTSGEGGTTPGNPSVSASITKDASGNVTGMGIGTNGGGLAY